MPPKRKPSARKTEENTQSVKKPRIPSERMADKMAARKLNNADLHEELQVILEDQGEKVSTTGIIFVTVPATSSIVPLENTDPLAPLDLSMVSQTVDATDETDATVEKVVMIQATDFFTHNNSTQNLFDDEQDFLGEQLLVAPDETQQPMDNCVPLRPVDFDIDLDAVEGDDKIPEPEIPTEIEGDDEITEPKIPIEGAASQNTLEAKCKRLEAENKRLTDQLKKCRRMLAKVEEAKLSSDDYALRVAKELQMVKDKEKIPQACFTEEDGIAVTIRDLEELNDRAISDSMFVGLLATRLVGAEKLRQMSVTGQASHRFAKMKKPDGTPLYPTPEKMDPAVLEFICNKVAERTALRIGPENAKTIRKRSESTVVKRYIAQKIANLKKAALVRQNRSEGCQLRESAVNVRV